jgi:hypothetical protein
LFFEITRKAMETSPRKHDEKERRGKSARQEGCMQGRSSMHGRHEALQATALHCPQQARHPEDRNPNPHDSSSLLLSDSQSIHKFGPLLFYYHF